MRIPLRQGVNCNSALSPFCTLRRGLEQHSTPALLWCEHDASALEETLERGEGDPAGREQGLPCGCHGRHYPLECPRFQSELS